MGVPCEQVQRRAFPDSLDESTTATVTTTATATATATAADGMDRARERERVRRAGRRIVVFPDLESVVETIGPNVKLECVQRGKVVEGSFAKGEWAVRFAE